MAISPVYDEYKRRLVSDFNTVATLEGVPYFLQTTGARLIELSKLLPEMRVLDVGTGAGLTTVVAAQIVGKRGKVVGIDLAPQMVERARQRLAKFNFQHVEFAEGDAEHLTFADASFDAVLCASSLYFMPDMAAALREWRRVLVPGGRCVFSTFAPSFLQPLHDLWKARLRQHGLSLEPLPTLRLPDAASCQSLLREVGFDVINVTTEQLGYYQTPEQRWQQLSKGLEGLPLSALSAAQLDQIKSEHLAELRRLNTMNGLWVDVPAIFAIGR